MKKNIITNFYENIFQLTTDPIYVYPEITNAEAPLDQPVAASQRTIAKKKNSHTTLFSALNSA
jgi:hypothetical protein